MIVCIVVLSNKLNLFLTLFYFLVVPMIVSMLLSLFFFFFKQKTAYEISACPRGLGDVYKRQDYRGI